MHCCLQGTGITFGCIRIWGREADQQRVFACVFTAGDAKLGRRDDRVALERPLCVAQNQTNAGPSHACRTRRIWRAGCNRSVTLPRPPVLHRAYHINERGGAVEWW